VGVVFLIVGSICLAAMIMVLLGFTHVLGNFHIWNGVAFPHLSHFFASSGHYYLMIVSLIILVLIPIVALIYGGIKILFNIRTKHNVLRAFLLTAWILALVLFITLIILNASNYAVETSAKQSTRIENITYPRLYIEIRDNAENKKIAHYSVFDQQFNYCEWDNSLYSEPEISLDPVEDKEMTISIEKHVNNIGIKHAQDVLDNVSYQWEQKDSVIYIDKYLSTHDENFWMFARVNINLRIPENQVVILSDRLCDMMRFHQKYDYCYDSALVGKPSIMTPDGLKLLEKQKSKSNRNK